MNKTIPKWPNETKALAANLHQHLIISDKNWHAFKGNSDRRAAEMLSAAIVQLLSDGERSDIEELLGQAMLWIKGEIKAPNCPHR